MLRNSLRRGRFFRRYSLFLLTALAVNFGCSTISKRQGTNVLVRDCGEFCGAIKSCAKKAGHPRLAHKLCLLARCETGSKCTGDIASLNGLYFGAFQFARLTWNSQCPAIFEQKHIEGCDGADAIYNTCCATVCAAEIIARGGASNWPVCGRKAEL